MPVLQQQEVFAGRYLLHQLIGEGGFSEVWMAKDQMADDAVVAVKIYAQQQGLDEWGMRQFRNEFALTHHLFHPHLLKVHHFDIAEGIPYLVMTYCPHGSLGHELRSKGVFSERQVALVMFQIGSALAEIHQQESSIIHQDIKPDNILLLQPDTYVLADFGISSRIRHTLTRTSITPQAISVAYAPPERFDHRPTANAASDVFSLGVTFYEMCTNTVPWEGAGGQCLLKGARVPTLPHGYSPELSQLLQSCMSEEPGKRPTAADLHLQGKHYLETGSWPAIRRTKKKRSVSTALVASLATAAVALAAVAGISLYDREQESPASQLHTATPVVVEAAPSGAVQSAPSQAVAYNSKASSPERTIKKTPPVQQAEEEEVQWPKEDTSEPASFSPQQTKKEPYTQQAQAKKHTQSATATRTEEWAVEQPLEAAAEEQPSAKVAITAKPEERQLDKVTPKELVTTISQPAPVATPAPVKTTASQPEKKEVTAAVTKQETSQAKVERPSTSNTSFGNEKKSLFDFNRKPNRDKEWRQYKRQYQKRLKKLRKGN